MAIRYIVRVHGDTFTQDYGANDPAHARGLAERAVKEGVWVGNTLYAPSRIVKVELMFNESGD